ncbi:MAG: VanZ family protein [Candidatus Nealsonbacteria bacterium]|nr:VanZ family protein [Candidatus Nealsonbacteria bacterium]
MKITPLRAAAFTLLLILLLLVPQPDWGRMRMLDAAGDMMHAPVFALFAVVIWKVLRTRGSGSDVRRGLIAFAIVAGFGAATEVLQGFVGRHPSWLDLSSNLLGSAAGILWMHRATVASAPRRRLAAGAVTLLAVAWVVPTSTLVDTILQQYEMPRLASFEHALELSRWRCYESRVARVPEHATHGDRALRVELYAGIYPGVLLDAPVPDWSAYDELAMDVTLPPDRPLDLVVKIEDEMHNGETDDRFNRGVRLHPGRQEVRIALSDVAAAPQQRTMDLRRIRRMQIFAADLSATRTFYLDNVRLECKKGAGSFSPP